METLKDRITYFADAKGISVRDFERACGMSNGYVTADRKSIGSEKLKGVTKAFPDLNRDWLLFGDGPMLLPSESPQSEPNGSAAVDHLIPNPRDLVRYYPNMPATASNISNMPEPSYEDQQPVLYLIPGLGGCDAFPATGNSMYPTITAGDIVIHRVWEDSSYIRNGEIYVILTTDGQRMIKRLTYLSTDEEGERHYICRSDNPDQSKYAPFEIEGSSILQLSIVRGIMTKLE